MSYYEHKYLKYKKKYLDLLEKNQNGGGIQEYKELFTTVFGNNWIITGSEAIKLYLEFFQRGRLLTFMPNDVDIIVVQPDTYNFAKIGDYIRKQSQPEKSMTFIKEEKSFDISTQETASYYEINGYRLIDPKVMLENYIDNRRNITDDHKIVALQEIIKLIEPFEKKRLPDNKRKRFEGDEEEGNVWGVSSKLFF
jgi:hypothetical protein